MAYVIAEPCIGTKDTACVDVCPVDCIHPRKDEPGFDNEKQLYINPAECIDCGACVPVCPVTDFCSRGFAGEVAKLHSGERRLLRQEIGMEPRGRRPFLRKVILAGEALRANKKGGRPSARKDARPGCKTSFTSVSH